MIEQFHFLRPWWLLLLLPLAAILWLLIKTRYQAGNWRAVIDERLLPFVLTGGGVKKRSWMREILAGVTVMVIVALAGPTWEKLPQPVYHRESALIVALDLSRSMNATDIKPTRLIRARHKIADILDLRKEGQTALVVYAADAFTVTPLTTDVDTILALLPGLESDLMPAQGSRADRALELALELFDNGGIKRGDVLLVSDGFSDLEARQVEDLLGNNPGHRVSVLAIGSRDGGPIPLKNGGFLKDRDGAIVIAAMREDNLRHIAQSGGGVYATISVDDIDINTLAYVLESSLDDREARLSDRATDLWRELGPWLVLFVLPLAALAFRRGLIWLVPVTILVLPPDAQALDWQSLWQNDNQHARQLFDQGEHAAAAEMFDDPAWQASSRYQAGDYAGAFDTWQQLDGEQALYNRATALAKLGSFEEALNAYETLLQQNPEHNDARFNKQAIEEWLDRQQQQQQGEQQAGEQQQQSGQNESRPGEPQKPAEAQPGGAEADDLKQSQQQQAQQQSEADQARSQEHQSQAADADRPQETPDEALARLDQQMSEQAAEQWLRKIPDDPGGLLRRKFIYQYRERGGVDAEVQSW